MPVKFDATKDIASVANYKLISDRFFEITVSAQSFHEAVSTRYSQLRAEEKDLYETLKRYEEYVDHPERQQTKDMRLKTIKRLAKKVIALELIDAYPSEVTESLREEALNDLALDMIETNINLALPSESVRVRVETLEKLITENAQTIIARRVARMDAMVANVLASAKEIAASAQSKTPENQVGSDVPPSEQTEEVSEQAKENSNSSLLAPLEKALEVAEEVTHPINNDANKTRNTVMNIALGIGMALAVAGIISAIVGMILLSHGGALLALIPAGKAIGGGGVGVGLALSSAGHVGVSHLAVGAASKLGIFGGKALAVTAKTAVHSTMDKVSDILFAVTMLLGLGIFAGAVVSGDKGSPLTPTPATPKAPLTPRA